MEGWLSHLRKEIQQISGLYISQLTSMLVGLDRAVLYCYQDFQDQDLNKNIITNWQSTIQRLIDFAVQVYFCQVFTNTSYIWLGHFSDKKKQSEALYTYFNKKRIELSKFEFCNLIIRK